MSAACVIVGCKKPARVASLPFCDRHWRAIPNATRSRLLSDDDDIVKAAKSEAVAAINEAERKKA